MPSPLVANDPHFYESQATSLQYQQIGPLRWTQGTTGPRISPNWEDDFSAMAYYGSIGLLDPTNIADVKFWRLRGLGFGAAFGLMGARAIAGGAVIGWAIDPADKREGGIAEWDIYQKRGPPSWVPRMERNWDRMWD